MTHLGVDAVGNRSGGGWSVFTRTLAGLVDDERFDQITVYCSPPDTWAGEPPRHDRVVYRPRPREHGSIPRRVAWYALELDRAARRDGVDVMLCLNGMGRTSAPRVNVVQQALIFADRRLQRGLAVRLAAIAQATEQSCRDADAIVVQTDSMRAHLIRDFGLERIRVLPLGLPTATADDVAPEERQRELLLVTSELRYKNAECVRAAFRTLRRDDRTLRLRAIGVDWPDDGVDSDGAVSPGEVPAAYERALVCVVPSFIESMGLPLVEAMAHHCPVVAADRPYAHDVCDNAALYFDPDSVTDLVRVVGEVTRDESLAADLVRRGDACFAALRDRRPVEQLASLLLEVA